MVDTSALTLQYEGSVKNVFCSPKDPQSLWFAFTDQYSVFDWGKMPDLIANKGSALALIGSHIFKALSHPSFWQKLPESPYLQKFDGDYLAKRFAHPVFSGRSGLAHSGLKSHFQGLSKGTLQSGQWQNIEPFSAENGKKIDNANLIMQVLGAKVNWPEHKTLLQESVYFYPTTNSINEPRLVPLEVVFRFGMLEGSALKKKLDTNPNYIDSLGLKTVPQMNEWFPHPVLEFFTKLEPKDRLLSWQEASLLANISANQFETLVETSLDIALGLHVLFAQSKLELWDGKLEFIFDASQTGGQLLLADSVGPDELRLLHSGIQLSKEVLRQYYRPSSWSKSLAEAQNLARQSGQENWQEICKNKLKQKPEPLEPDMRRLIDQMYGVLANQLLGYPAFDNHPNLEEFATSLQGTLSHYTKGHVHV